MLNDKAILITGGTGSFGHKFTEILLKNYEPKKIIILSRDEFKQYQMAKKFSDRKYPIRLKDKYKTEKTKVFTKLRERALGAGTLYPHTSSAVLSTARLQKSFMSECGGFLRKGD